MGRLRDWYRSTFGHALVGCALLWAALPPLNWWPLAWIAPMWWVLLIRRQELSPQPEGSRHGWLRPLPLLLALAVLVGAGMAGVAFFHERKYNGFWMVEIFFWPLALAWLMAAPHVWRRPYVVLWLAGFAFWLTTLQWLRLPHWATSGGWLAISFYLAFYLPVFIGLSRVAVHRLRVPVILAAPVVWAGLELARAHLLTGFTLGNLGHTQYRWTELIQISDLTGDYGVGFVVMFVAACAARMARVPGAEGRPDSFRSVSLWPLLPAAAVLAVVLAYGYFRTAGEYTRPGARVALIQGDLDARLKSEEGSREVGYQHYLALSKDALKEFGAPDLIVWPETSFLRTTLVTCAANPAVPEEVREQHPRVTPAEFRAAMEESYGQPSREEMAALAKELGTSLLVGVDRQHFGRDGIEYFNSAVYLTAEGKLADNIYSKMHLVMFGEYVPFTQYLPWLQRLTPLSVSAAAGERAEVFSVAGVRVAPNICFETVIPHAIRAQVNALTEEGGEPDILVNLTNDGWFWGSSELELHLVCGVFRAVECRKPLLIAANTGISAWIDGDGRLLDRAPRRVPRPLLAEVDVDQRQSWYLAHGDWPAGACLAACAMLAMAGLAHPRLATASNGKTASRMRNF